MPEPKPRAIRFRAHEVRAAFAGTLTEVWRYIEPSTAYSILSGPGKTRDWQDADYFKAFWNDGGPAPGWWTAMRGPGSGPPKDNAIAHLKCPFGAPGQLLWVQETWFDNNGVEFGHPWWDREQFYYRADGTPDFEGESVEHDGGGWRPSTQMRRELSRLTFRLKEVHARRVGTITAAEAIGTGIVSEPDTDGTPMWVTPTGWKTIYPEHAFGDFWTEAHGKRPGDLFSGNPWAWRLVIERVDQAEVHHG